jgi:mannan endo-1,4-beta-mannosidase
LRAIDGFVTRDGSSLMLCGQPFQAMGTNIYYLQSYSVYEASKLTSVADGLDDAVRMSLPVVRMWAFNDGGSDPAAIRTAPDKYNEKALVGLDTAIAEAKKRGIRVILALTNYWKDYGGLPTYATWAGGGAKDEDFYTNTTMQGYFKEYATMFANRTNTVTGVPYKDEPAIMAWEIANELRCKSCTDSSALIKTIDELSKFLKGLFPKQLIADGGEGFDDVPDYWTLSNKYVVRGDEHASFSKMVKLTALDMVSYHYYPAAWGMADSPSDTVNADAKNWVEGHAALAKAAGKVAYWGEFGFKTGTTDAIRAPLYDNWLTNFYGANKGALALFWQLIPQSRGADDGFACILGRDPATVTVFEKYSQPLALR